MKWTKGLIEQEVEKYNSLQAWREMSNPSYKAAIRISKTDKEWYSSIKNKVVNTKICSVCGNDYTPRIYNSITCSKECSTKNRRNAINIWRKENADYHKNYAVDNRDHYKKINKEWAINNRELCNEKTRRYQASKLNATPKWLTNDHIKELKEIYQNCPKGHHVDHIVPLQGKTVSGLHVPWNLQILTASENLSKGNDYSCEG